MRLCTSSGVWRFGPGEVPARLGALAGACLLVLAAMAGSASAASLHGRPGGHRNGESGAARARAAIVGGSQIQVTQVPWEVEVEAYVPAEGEVLDCGGSILDATHVLTAAHCLFNPRTSERIAPENVFVIAGTSNIDATQAQEPTQQVTRAASVRVHPYFSYAEEPAAPDDIAVVELQAPLTLSTASGSAASAIGLVATGTTLPEGFPVALAGFGLQAPGSEPDGLLYSLGMAVGYSRQCGGEADALYVCASTASGSVCSGDSGSGLTEQGVAPTLVGVADTVQVISGVACRDGAVGGFVNLAAPEIRDFLEGSEAPPRAPRGGAVSIEGVPTVGRSLTCAPGDWSNVPTFTFTFTDGAGGQALQTGSSSTYLLSAADVGRSIACEVQAANAGGTGVGRTPALGPIVPARAVVSPPLPSIPPPTPSAPLKTEESGSVALLGGSLAVQSGGVAEVKLGCVVSEGCSGKLTLVARVQSRGRRRRAHTETIGSASFAIAGDGTVTVKLALNAAGRGQLAADHGTLEGHLTILQLQPAPAQTWTEEVRLRQQKRSSRASRRRRS